MIPTLETVSGIYATIHELPGRPPFMLAADLATAYGTTVKRLNQAVVRNPERFPNDFAFRLTEDEQAGRWSQTVTTSPGKRTDLQPLVFTHAGALMLSAVLRTPVAVQTSLTIHRAFAIMEAQAMEDVRHLLEKVQADALYRKPVRGRIQKAVEQGWTFEQIHDAVGYTKPKLVQAIKDCIGLGLIDEAPKGTPFEKLKPKLDTRQMDMFDGA